MASESKWHDQLTDLWDQFSNVIDLMRKLDFYQLSLRDILTLIGFAITCAKTLYGLWNMFGAFKQYGVARLMRPNLIQKYGKWAVVVGAEFGIGEAYMTELAMGGINLLLISRGIEQLRTTAVYLEEKYKIKVKLADIDFSSCLDIYGIMQNEIEGQNEIGMLVCNIRIDQSDPVDFCEVDPEEACHMLHSNVIGATLLTHMVLPRFVDRGKGAIIMIAGTASRQAVSNLAIYAATKAYLLSFTESLRTEYKGCGVTIQTLMPSVVAGSTPGVDESSMIVPDCQAYAHKALSTLGWATKSDGCLTSAIQTWLGGHLPEFCLSWLTNQVSKTIHHKAAHKLGLAEIDEEPLYDSTSQFYFDSSFLAPQSLLGLLGNSG